MSYPSRCETRAIALVEVSQLCRRASRSFACSSVSPRMGITPGRIATSFDVERAFDAEESSLVIERPDLRFVEEGAGRLVGHDRTVVPCVPQPAHHVHELGRDLVT